MVPSACPTSAKLRAPRPSSASHCISVLTPLALLPHVPSHGFVSLDMCESVYLKGLLHVLVFITKWCGAQVLLTSRSSMCASCLPIRRMGVCLADSVLGTVAMEGLVCHSDTAGFYHVKVGTWRLLSRRVRGCDLASNRVTPDALWVGGAKVEAGSPDRGPVAGVGWAQNGACGLPACLLVGCGEWGTGVLSEAGIAFAWGRAWSAVVRGRRVNVLVDMLSS